MGPKHCPVANVYNLSTASRGATNTRIISSASSQHQASSNLYQHRTILVYNTIYNYIYCHCKKLVWPCPPQPNSNCNPQCLLKEHYLLLLITEQLKSAINLKWLQMSSSGWDLGTITFIKEDYRVSYIMPNHIPIVIHFLDYLNIEALSDFFLWSIYWNLCNLAMDICLLM